MNPKQIEEDALHPSEKDETVAKFPFSVVSGRAGIHRPRETRHDVPSGHSREGGNPCVWKFDAAAFAGMPGKRGNDEAWK